MLFFSISVGVVRSGQGNIKESILLDHITFHAVCPIVIMYSIHIFVVRSPGPLRGPLSLSPLFTNIARVFFNTFVQVHPINLTLGHYIYTLYKE